MCNTPWDGLPVVPLCPCRSCASFLGSFGLKECLNLREQNLHCWSLGSSGSSTASSTSSGSSSGSPPSAVSVGSLKSRILELEIERSALAESRGKQQEELTSLRVQVRKALLRPWAGHMRDLFSDPLRWDKPRTCSLACSLYTMVSVPWHVLLIQWSRYRLRHAPSHVPNPR